MAVAVIVGLFLVDSDFVYDLYDETMALMILLFFFEILNIEIFFVILLYKSILELEYAVLS